MTALTLDKTPTADPFACPSWCTVDHAGDDPADTFHRSAPTAVAMPAAAVVDSWQDGDGWLPTRLVAHSVDRTESCIAIGDSDAGFDLTTPDAVDEYLSNLTDHLFEVRALRDQLAAIQAGA